LPDVPAGSGFGQSLVARCSRPAWDAPSKLNSVCGRAVPIPPFRTPCGAVLGEPETVRPNSQRSTPGATRP
jgi:hypothetical protein